MKPEYILTDQGSEEWAKLKLGVISASNISKAIAKVGSETRNSYMMELVAQIATQEHEEINSKYIEWGKTQEPFARSRYEFETNDQVDQIGFIYNLDKRIGCSPDGIITNKKKGLEIKCPFTGKVHVDFLAMEKIKPEYYCQIQFGLFVSGLEIWDFCSFHPKFQKTPIKIITIGRDEKLMERFKNDIGEFILDMDSILDRLNLKWGQQWE